MRSSVQKGVEQIPQEEAREKSPGQYGITDQSKDDIKDTEQHTGHNKSGNRRHQKAFGVLWIEVMGTVHDKMKALHKRTL